MRVQEKETVRQYDRPHSLEKKEGIVEQSKLDSEINLLRHELLGHEYDKEAGVWVLGEEGRFLPPAAVRKIIYNIKSSTTTPNMLANRTPERIDNLVKSIRRQVRRIMLRNSAEWGIDVKDGTVETTLNLIEGYLDGAYSTSQNGDLLKAVSRSIQEVYQKREVSGNNKRGLDLE